jgi:hypothetical protein
MTTTLSNVFVFNLFNNLVVNVGVFILGFIFFISDEQIVLSCFKNERRGIVVGTFSSISVASICLLYARNNVQSFSFYPLVLYTLCFSILSYWMKKSMTSIQYQIVSFCTFSLCFKTFCFFVLREISYSYFCMAVIATYLFTFAESAFLAEQTHKKTDSYKTTLFTLVKLTTIDFVANVVFLILVELCFDNVVVDFYYPCILIVTFVLAMSRLECNYFFLTGFILSLLIVETHLIAHLLF